MKAIKIYNIIWNTENVSKELVDNLPKYKCFTAKDDFDVVGRGPEILKKKYGVPVVCFTYSILRVVHTTEDLIMLAAPKGEKPKKIFTKTGEETDYGKKLIAEIKLAVARRKEMEAQNITVNKIPAFYDEVRIAIENITAMEWDGASYTAPDGEVCRNASATLTETVKIYEVKYSDSVDLPDTEGYRAILAYGTDVLRPSGKMTYKVEAKALYELIPAETADHTALFIGIGVAVLALLAAVILFIIAKKKKSKKSEYKI